MRAVPQEERAFGSYVPRLESDQLRSRSNPELTADASFPNRQDEEEPFRQIRTGSLQSLLDEEFRRNYRFEGLSDFFLRSPFLSIFEVFKVA